VSLKRILFNHNVLSALIIAFFLGALYFLPKVLRQNTYQLTPEVAKDTAPGAPFPMDKKLSRLVVNKGGTVTPLPPTTLKELLAGNDGTLVVNFWATWCAPCIEELPSLEYLSRQLEARKPAIGPRVVAISVDENAREIATLFKTLDFTPSFLLLHDPDSKFAGEVGTTKFPETFLVDRTGAIRKKWLGPQEWLSAPILSDLAQLPSSP